MSKYRHILFDIDGTLVDTYEANMHSIIDLLDRYMPGHDRTVENLVFIYGLPGPQCLKILGVPDELVPQILSEWLELVSGRAHMCRLYDGVIPMLDYLKGQGYHMAVVTSRTRGVPMGGPLGDYIPGPLRPYLNHAICANDVTNPKPHPESIELYMKQTGASREEIIFIGDAHTDLQCARDAGVDFGLAVWGYRGLEHLYCDHYFKTPWEVVSMLSRREQGMDLAAQMHIWASEINAIGQIGLSYVQDRFDRERYERLMDIAAAMASHYVFEKQSVIRKQWCTEGYKTPMLDTRAAIFDNEDRILLVKEKMSGKWSLPGGWCDDNMTIISNTLKEVREEACMDVFPVKLIAIQDRNAHNIPKHICGCLKAFVECNAGPGEFVENIETSERRFFAENELPPLDQLRTSTTSLDQLMMCFHAHRSPDWKPVVE